MQATTDVFSEKVRVRKLSRIRQILFGSLDGLLVPLGVISGVAGGVGTTKAVIVAGLAESFAGALSMGAGEFISGRAEAQVHRGEILAEFEQMRVDPEFEFREMVQMLEFEGVKHEDALAIANRLQLYPGAFAKMMIEKELGLEIEPQLVKVAEGLSMSSSYLVASIVPLIAYFFFPIHTAYIVSLLLSILFLIVLGIVKGKIAKISLFVSALEVLAVGILSGLGGYFLGSWLPRLFGY